MNPLVVGSSPALPTNTRGRAHPYDVPGSQPGRGPFSTVSTIHKGGSMAHEKSHSEVAAALKRLGQYRGILSSKQLKTIKGQIIAGDICGAEKGLRRLLPAIHFEGGIANEVHSPRQ